MSETLQKLQEYLERQKRLEYVCSLLYWDMQTVMPKKGFAGNSDAAAYFSTEAFRMSTSDELGELLAVLNGEEEYGQLDDMWKFVVRRMKEDMDRDKRIPVDFYSAYVQAQNEAVVAWKEAKNASDYALFAPHLDKLIGMTKQMAAYTDPDKEVYDALLDQFEKGMDSAAIDRLFGELKEELVPLVKEALAKKQPENPKFSGYFDPDAQRKVQKLLLDYIGFDWEKGAVGETEHPFTINFCSQDVRVTNHYHAKAPLSAIFTAIHEGGHAIFEQNVNPAYDGTVAGGCRYMGLHESQSRFFENILGRNENFWVPIYGEVQKLLPQLAEVSLEEFVREINRVQASFIRTEADELTYCLHVIIRYEMEKAIFRENVSVDKLPALWNEKMEEYLGITPANDAEGILQDSHWSGGSFGYFPSYLLGSIYDGMFLEAAERELGSVDVLLREGRIREITRWLNEKIHVYGSTRTPKEVLAAVCGGQVSAKPLIAYFKHKAAK